MHDLIVRAEYDERDFEGPSWLTYVLPENNESQAVRPDLVRLNSRDRPVLAST